MKTIYLVSVSKGHSSTVLKAFNNLERAKSYCRFLDDTDYCRQYTIEEVLLDEEEIEYY